MAYKTPKYKKVVRKQEGMAMEFYAPITMILDIINMATIIYNITQNPPQPQPPTPQPPAPVPPVDYCALLCCGGVLYSTRNASFSHPVGC